MKIQFDFSKHRNSPYSNLLADYMYRLEEFAKLGEFKGEYLDLCFVAGRNDTRVHRSKSDGCLSCLDDLRERSHLSPLDISSEELSELIQKSLSGGISNIRVTVKKMDDWRNETARASVPDTVLPGEGSSGAAPSDAAESGTVPFGALSPDAALFESDAAKTGTVYISLLRCKIGTDLAEVLAAEQVYRAFMIFHNRKYHK